jgi:hypothetical protein
MGATEIAMSKLLTRKKLVGTLAIFGILGAVAWSQWRPLWAQYCVQQLAQADDAGRDKWVTSVIALDESAVPALLACLQNADQNACENLRAALVELARKWGADDTRSGALLEQIASRFASFDVCAMNSALRCATVLARKTPGRENAPTMITHRAGELLTSAVKVEAVRPSALRLAGVLVEQTTDGELLELCRGLALEGLAAADADTRVAATELILRQPFRSQSDLLAKVVPLLRDDVAAVRKHALLAVGPVPELVSDDQLLPLLHDADDEVQNLGELTLRSRGLRESHILLARLITDERPSARLQVLQHLRDVTDLEPGVWLRRLCEDPAPAVRAAAIRAAASQSQVDLRQCLADMARQDPSPTVRELAGHYLSRSRPSVGD